MKTDNIIIRCDPELKQAIKRTAAKLDRSMSEIFLRSVTNDLSILHNGMAKKAQGVVEQLPEGELKERVAALYEESARIAKYFRDHLENVDNTAPMLREIENLESYRDFLRETVTVEA